jgi:hypothetical protein
MSRLRRGSPNARAMVMERRERRAVMRAIRRFRNAVTHRAKREATKQEGIGKPPFARVSHAVYPPLCLRAWRIKNLPRGGGVALRPQ